MIGTTPSGITVPQLLRCSSIKQLRSSNSPTTMSDYELAMMTEIERVAAIATRDWSNDQKQRMDEFVPVVKLMASIDTIAERSAKALALACSDSNLEQAVELYRKVATAAVYYPVESKATEALNVECMVAVHQNMEALATWHAHWKGASRVPNFRTWPGKLPCEAPVGALNTWTASTFWTHFQYGTGYQVRVRNPLGLTRYARQRALLLPAVRSVRNGLTATGRRTVSGPLRGSQDTRKRKTGAFKARGSSQSDGALPSDGDA